MSGTLICGKTTGNAVVPVQVNADGTLEMTAEIDSSALAKETTLDSFRTDNASNLGVIATTLDDGTQKAKCMGITGAGLPQQMLVEADGSTIIGGGTVKTAVSSVDGSTQHLQVNGAGELITTSSGGGGSTQYAVATTGMATGTGTLMIGSAAGSAKEVNVSTAGSINTKETELKNEGTTGNANPAAGTSMAPGTYSLVVNISNMREASILYNDASTASFDGLDIEVSADSSTYYRLDGIYPFQVGSVRTAYRGVSLHGLTHLRLKNVSSTDTYTSVSGTVVGCP